MVALCLMVAIVAAPAVGGAADTVPDRGIGLRPAPAVTQERRVALVIGNSGYRYDRLLNPVNDARDFADALRGLGFDVEAHLDADRRTMRKAIIDFGRRLGDGGVGLFYFAGHGVRVGDENYLIPVGAAIDVEEHVEVDAVGLNQVVARMGGARNRLNIVILDACRNNPFASRFRSPVRGLAQTRAPRGTYIAYATAPGEVASDGDGAHSLYTAALLEAVAAPGLKLEDVFKRVRARVAQRTDGRQVPWTSSSITGNFSFARRRPPPRPRLRAPPRTPTPTRKPCSGTP